MDSQGNSISFHITNHRQFGQNWDQIPWPSHVIYPGFICFQCRNTTWILDKFNTHTRNKVWAETFRETFNLDELINLHWKFEGRLDEFSRSFPLKSRSVSNTMEGRWYNCCCLLCAHSINSCNVSNFNPGFNIIKIPKSSLDFVIANSNKERNESEGDEITDDSTFRIKFEFLKGR